MHQPSLFDPPKDDTPRPVKLDGLRRHLQNDLYILRRAEVMPWSELKQKFKTKDFYYYSEAFPDVERKALEEEFEREMARLRKASEEAA